MMPKTVETMKQGDGVSIPCYGCEGRGWVSPSYGVAVKCPICVGEGRIMKRLVSSSDVKEEVIEEKQVTTKTASVGDKIKIIGDTSLHNFTIGKTVTVVPFGDYCPTTDLGVVATDGMRQRYVEHKDYEIVPTPVEPTKKWKVVTRMAKVGDTIRIKQDTSFHYREKGDILTVVDLQVIGVGAEVNGLRWYVPNADFDVVEEDTCEEKEIAKPGDLIKITGDKSRHGLILEHYLKVRYATDSRVCAYDQHGEHGIVHDDYEIVKRADEMAGPGDAIKIVANTSYHRFAIGEVVTVKETINKHILGVNAVNAGEKWYVRHDDYEIVKRANEIAKPGDRIRIVGNTSDHQFEMGETVVVRDDPFNDEHSLYATNGVAEWYVAHTDYEILSKDKAQVHGGDKIRIIDNTSAHHFNTGEVAIVDYIRKESVHAKNTRTSWLVRHEDYIVLPSQLQIADVGDKIKIVQDTLCHHLPRGEVLTVVDKSPHSDAVSVKSPFRENGHLFVPTRDYIIVERATRSKG